MHLRKICKPRRLQKGLTVAFSRVVGVKIMVAVQEAATGNEYARHALVLQHLGDASPLTVEHAREGSDVLGLPFHNPA